MKRKIGSILLIITLMLIITGCGNKTEKVDDNSALSTIRNAINKVYDKKEKLTTNNVQKYMVGNWVIVEAPANTIRQSIPKELDKATGDDEWTTMFITACNSKTNACKDLKIMKSSEDNKLFVGSESVAIAQ